MIGPYFDGGVALDLFAGSGALGIEALSRGVDHAVFVDVRSTDIVLQNLDKLELRSSATVIRSSFPGVVARLQGLGLLYDWVFLDPPYQLDLCAQVIADLCKANLLMPRATIIAEQGSKQVTPSSAQCTLRSEHRYGDSKVCLFRYEGYTEQGGISLKEE